MARHIKALIVVPENNTTMEPEISALCPALAPIQVARVKRPARTLLLEDLPAYAEATLDAIAPFAAEPLDLVIYGCTAAGFLGGPASNARMVERLAARTGATVVSTAGAMIDALRSAGVFETAVVTPYLQPVNDGLRDYLQKSDIEVETLNRGSSAGTGAADGNAAEQEPVRRLFTIADAQRDRGIARRTHHSRLVVDPGHRLGRRGGADETGFSTSIQSGRVVGPWTK
jgi:maleate cis-trans isomerase